MVYNKRLKEMIKRHEGYRPTVYQCPAGRWTIGYGRNVQDVGITQTEAELLLLFDIATCETLLGTIFGEDLGAYRPARHDALVDMIFNLGYSRFRGFQAMIAAIKNWDWGRAAEEALDSRWAEQVGARAREIAHMLRTGEYMI